MCRRVVEEIYKHQKWVVWLGQL